MEETEAETALLALGPQLEWREFRLRGRFDSWAAPVRKGAYYHTFRPVRQDFHVCVFRDPEQIYNYQASSLREAKAACERHYATGQWD